MKTILLIGSSVLLLSGCIASSENEIVETLSVDEMKSRVEAEEIVFVIDCTEVISSHNPKLDRPVSRGWEDVDKRPFEKDEVKIGRIYERPIVVPSKPPKLPLPPHGPRSDTNKYGVYYFVEVEARFPGGAIAMKKFIIENIHYLNRDLCVEGRVYVQFIIEKDGCITHLKVMRGGISEELNEEALRLIRSMPKWIPAQNNGKVVAAFVRLPISFTLN